MSGFVKRAVKGALARAGLEVRNRRTLYADHVEDLRRVLGAASPLVIFDVGANRGDTVAAYRAAFPAAHVHAFEPTPDLAGRLADRFRADPNVTVAPVAVSDAVGTSTFHLASSNVINSLLPYHDAGRDYYGITQEQQITVPTTTLSEYATARSVADVGLLKLDIQGAEKLALEGARPLFDRGAVRAIYTEVTFAKLYAGQTTIGDIDGFLAGYGYRLFGFYEFDREGNGCLHYCSALYLDARTYQNLDPQFLFPVR